jgi:hypothetical protein
MPGFVPLLPPLPFYCYFIFLVTLLAPPPPPVRALDGGSGHIRTQIDSYKVVFVKQSRKKGMQKGEM